MVGDRPHGCTLKYNVKATVFDIIEFIKKYNIHSCDKYVQIP